MCGCVGVCVCVHLWTTRVSVWVGVRVAVTQTWAASKRLAGMSDDRQMAEAGYGVGSCRSDCRMHCLADRVLFQLSTKYRICDTKFIIRVTYTRTW